MTGVIEKLGIVRLTLLMLAVAATILLLAPVSAGALDVTISAPGLLPTINLSLPTAPAAPAPAPTYTPAAPAPTAPAAPTLGGLINNVQGIVNTLPLPQPSSSGLPTIPAYDPNTTIQQTVNTVNSVSPIQVPSSALPTLPVTTPAIDPNAVVGSLVNTVNTALPLTLPNPIDVLYSPNGLLSGLSDGLPIISPLLGGGGLTGGDVPLILGPGPSILTTSPTGLASPAGLLGLPGTSAAIPSQAALAAGVRPIDPNGEDYRLSAMSPSDGDSLLQSAAKGLYVLPVLGLACVALALVSYLRSSRSIWSARRA